jgi:hypothetical protein
VLWVHGYPDKGRTCVKKLVNHWSCAPWSLSTVAMFLNQLPNEWRVMD